MTFLLAPHPLLILGSHIVLRTHAVFFVIGAESAALFLSSWLKKRGLSADEVPVAVFMAFVLGLVAARVGFFLSYPSQFQNLIQVLEIWKGGLVSYWGLAAGVSVLAFRLRHKISREKKIWWDGIVLSGLLGWGIGRLGNYYAADSVGVLSTHWALFYGRVPIQLMESLLCLAAFFFFAHKKWQPGEVAWEGFITYFAGRAVIDTWRFEGVVAALHLSQWVSIVALVTIVIAYRHAHR